MNNKFNYFLSLVFLLSNVTSVESYYDCYSDLFEPVNQFCGLYVGANFNFGSVNFLSQTNAFTEQDLTDPSGDAFIFQNGVQGCGIRESINALGGGVTAGWNWSNKCWYLAVEFNGIFYGNPCTLVCNDCCDTDSCDSKLSKHCNISACNQFLLNVDKSVSGGGSSFDVLPSEQYLHSYKNNVRLDAVFKVGLLTNPCTTVYLLAGGGGLLVEYSQSLTTEIQNDSVYTLQNNPDNSFCCDKWLSGGTVGFGLKNILHDCFDLVMEFRYARYKNWCGRVRQENVVNSEFVSPDDAEVLPGEFSVESKTTFKTDSYLGLIGLNWHF